MLAVNTDTVAYHVSAFAVMQREHLVNRSQEILDVHYNELVDRAIDPAALDAALEHVMNKEHITAASDLQRRFPADHFERSPLLADTHLSVSESRVLGQVPDPVRLPTEYDERRLGDGVRLVVGTHYLPNQSWSKEDSVLTYMEIVASLRDEDVSAEEVSPIFKTMMVKLKHVLWKDGRLNKAFANELDKRGFIASYRADAAQLRVKLMKDRPYPDLVWQV